MTVRRYMGPRKDDKPRVEIPEQGVVDPGETYGAHEIDGDLFGPGEEETDATETLANPLDTLEAVPLAEEGSLLDKFTLVTMEEPIGRSVVVPANIAGGVNRATTEILAARLSDQLSSMFTVTVQPLPSQLIDNVPGFPSFTASGLGQQPNRMVVLWGAGGVQFETAVDILPGQTFTVGGSFLRLLAVNNVATSDIAYGAFVSLLPRSSPKAARLTFMTGPIAAGGSLNPGVLPSFMKSVRFYRTPFATTSFLVRFHIGVTVIGETGAAAGADCPQIETPGYTNLITFLNNGALDIAQSFAVFDLAL